MGEMDLQPVHGDVSPVNMVFPPGSEFVLIDWDNAHLGFRVYDALGDVLNRPAVEDAAGARFSWEEVRRYLRGYAAATRRPLTPSELRCVPAFCLARHLEDLRQRLFVLASLAREADATYAALIAMRVLLMNQIIQTCDEEWSEG
jgi:Ser/Thr protein kinase RdoA (MazF antagonist)